MVDDIATTPPHMTTTFEPTHFAVRVMLRPATLITVLGELDLAAVPVFEAALQKLELRPGESVVLDLRRLHFIDAAGLHAVLGLHEECRKLSTALAILPGPRNVQRVFELTGTDQLMAWRATDAERHGVSGPRPDQREANRSDTAAPRREPQRKKPEERE